MCEENAFCVDDLFEQTKNMCVTDEYNPNFINAPAELQSIFFHIN